MSRFHSYLISTKTILEAYQGKEPFSLFIRRFFSRNKRYGSRDRWLISDFCYYYFRLGKALIDLPVEERILTGIFLSSGTQNQMLETHTPEWNVFAEKSLEEKCETAGVDYRALLDSLFPWKEELSSEIDFDELAASYFIKPDVFLRIRLAGMESVRRKLKSAHIPYKEISENILSVPSGTKADRELNIDSEVVVQDLSSQRIGDYVSKVVSGDDCSVWDCCAASGGKSIMAYDLNTKIKLTVSDVREFILGNLDSRFKTAGITKYTSFQADLTLPDQPIPNAPFDVIIADVPCTGSGTWRRTPEHLFYFEESKIGDYASLQKKIVANTVPHLKPGGHLLYITCSLFRKENEEVVEYIHKELGLEVVETALLNGIEERADVMFCGVFRLG